jgi:drug/metabolite transporter (DMT)-like permease
LDISLFAPLMALAAAGSWGAGDFTGGLATRKSNALRTVLMSYSVGLVAVVILALAHAEPLSSTNDLLWGAVAGLCGMVGVGFLFQGFATGRMGIVAPISAVLATAIPVIFHAVTDNQSPPDEQRLVGFALALIGIWLLSRPERLGGRPDGLGSAVIAGFGFAFFFICLDQVSENATFWPLVSGRLTACAAMLMFALATRRPLKVTEAPWGLIVTAGVLDIAGNYFFLQATQTGRLDITVVLASLYPAVTTLLALVIAREHIHRMQMAGVFAAVLAIVLITIPKLVIG